MAIMSLLLLSLAAGASPTQTSVQLAPFSSIQVSGSFSVRLVRGNEYRALLTLEEGYADYVKCDVVSGALQIALDERKVPAEVKRLYRGKGTPDPVFSAVVYVPELVKGVKLSDKAVLFESEDVFDKARIDIEMNGNSELQSMHLSSQLLRIVMHNKSKASLSFTGQRIEVETANGASLTLDENSESSDYFLQGNSKITAISHTGAFGVRTKGNSSMKVSGSADKAMYELYGTSEVDAYALETPDAKVTMSSVCMLSQSAYENLTVSLNGGSSLYFSGEPHVTVENIKSASMIRITDGKSPSKL